MIDITRYIHAGMAIYPGNPAVSFSTVSVASAQSSALTAITLGSHTGTHLDAPAHITAGGAGTAEYSLEQLCGPCEVVAVQPVGTVIAAGDLPATHAPRVLIKTVNSDSDIDTFVPDFVALEESAAVELVRRGVQLVGIDAPSIKKRGVRDSVHQQLLDAGIVILEGLWLAGVEPGPYELLCLPLPVDLDGAPVRAALRPV